MAHSRTGVNDVAKLLTLGRLTRKKKAKKIASSISKAPKKPYTKRLAKRNRVKGSTSRTSVDATLRKKKAAVTDREKRKEFQRYNQRGVRRD